LVCFLLLNFSLRKHLKDLTCNATGLKDPSTRAHIRAMKPVVLFLSLFAVYFLMVIISFYL
jgi:taste receptor type 2